MRVSFSASRARVFPAERPSDRRARFGPHGQVPGSDPPLRSENQDCVQVTDSIPGILPVRDSKQPEGPVPVFGSDARASFLTTVV